MKLYEVGEYETIQIIARMEKTSVQYMSVVVMNRQEFLFIAPIMHEGRIVNFDAAQVRISVIYVGADNRPLVWDECILKTMIYQNKKYQIIYSGKDGRLYNRREAYRQYIGTKGIIQSEKTRDISSIIVKDISISGVAFVADTKLELPDISEFHLNFDDSECRLAVSLSGRLIREDMVDENKRVFGGIITKSNVNLNTYVVLKQKNEVARRYGRKQR